jgi:hypothetical protein
MTRRVSRQSSTTPTTRSTPPCPRASACPRCQPPRLVTRLLRSVSQVPALALHRSRSISTSPHDLHLSHRPPSLCSTPAHHKPTDMVAHTQSHTLVSPLTTPECYPLTITHHQPEPQGTSQPCVHRRAATYWFVPLTIAQTPHGYLPFIISRPRRRHAQLRRPGAGSATVVRYIQRR